MHVAYEFGPYRLDAARRQLTGAESATIEVTAKVFDALSFLVAHPGRLVSRAELTEVLWPHTIVEDNNLNQTIWALRRALGDHGHEKAYVATVPGRGYQFVAEVRCVVPAAPVVPASDPAIHPDRAYATTAAPITADSPHPAVPVSWRQAVRARLGRARLGIAITVLVLVTAGVYEAWREHKVPVPERLGSVERVVPLTTLPGDEYAPALSPDGSFVAFAWDQGNGYPDIYVKAVAGSENPVRLTNEQGPHSDPAWSPDGGRIAYLRQRGPTDFDVLVAPVLGGGPAQKVASLSMMVISQEGSPRISWTPDGEHLLFSTRASAEAVAKASTLIHAVALRTGEVTVVSSGERVFDTSPAIAPDSARLAFTRYDVSQRLPVLMVQPLGTDMAGQSDARPVPGVPPGVVHSPSWSPDGHYLTFVVGLQVFEWPVGGVARPVYATGSLLGTLSMVWKNGRTSAVASVIHTDNDLWVLPIEPPTLAAVGPPTPRLRSTEFEHHPRFSPDGRQLAFVSRRNGGAYAIWLADADGGNPRQLTSIGAVVSGYPNWSPDSSRIAFHASFPGRPREIYLVDIAAGTTTPIGEGATPSWSADGEHIYVGEIGRPSTSTTVTRIRVHDGAREQLFIGSLPTETRDGAHLLHAKMEKFGIWRRALDGDVANNPEEQLVDDYTPALGGIVPLDDGFVYPGHTPEGVPRAFRFYDYATREARDIAPAPASLALGLTVSADRRELLYSAAAPGAGADLVLLEFE